MVRTGGAVMVVAIGAALAAAGVAPARGQSVVAEPNPLAEPFKAVAERVGEPMASTPEWLRVYAGAVIDDWATVRTDAKALAAKFPRSPEPEIALAVGLEGGGDHDGAITALRKAVELDPQHLGGWLMLVQMYYRTDKLQDAAAALEQARKVSPDNVDILMSLAKAYVRLNDAERASLVLSGATKAAPDNVEAWVNYLSISARTKRADAAWREFDQLKATRPLVAQTVSDKLPKSAKRPAATP